MSALLSDGKKSTSLVERSLKRFALNYADTELINSGCDASRTNVIMLIGEKPTKVKNPFDVCDLLSVPFGSLSGCSGWLNNLLEDAGIQEEKLFWLNTYDGFGQKTDIQKFVTQIDPCEIITLGNVAHDAVETLGIPHIKQRHPQYWKRFKSSEKYPLIDLLLGMVNK